MKTTVSKIQDIKDRKSVVDVDINVQIKSMQRQLVELSFSSGNNSKEYHLIMNQIKSLRSSITL